VRRAAAVLLLAPLARGDASLPGRGASPSLGIYFALVPPTGEEARLLVTGDGRRLAPGERLQVLDMLGRAGVAEVTADPVPPCSSAFCPAVQMWARWSLLPRRAPLANLYLVGPIDRPLPRARLLVPAPPDPGGLYAPPFDPEGSATIVAIDLDGDGRSDLESRVRRCSETPRPPGTCTESRRRAGESWQMINRKRHDYDGLP
jgi:hypothetical protein